MVLSDRALSDANILGRDLRYIQIANDTFDLGIEIEANAYTREIKLLMSTLRNPGVGDAQDLLYLALSREGSKDTPGSLYEPGRSDDAKHIKIWREFGFPELADLLGEWWDLADEVEIKIVNEGTEDAYPDIANMIEINRKIASIRSRMSQLPDDVMFSSDEIAKIVCEEFNLELRPHHLFQKFWIDRIIQSPGFSTFEPSVGGESWSLGWEPYGWLTKRHGAALQKHGYTYKFAFWEQEIGETRGHLWIQTDQGPLMLTDKTDSTSLRSNFPVQVSSVSGKKMFKLREQDVPDGLMQDGPNIPLELSARSSAQRDKSRWREILGRFINKR